MTSADLLLQQIVNGLSVGAVYALLALGFTLVYGILELINFAHFNVFMIGSFIGLFVLQAFGISGQATILHGAPLVFTLLAALLAAMLGCGLLGVAIERIALRPLRFVSGPAAMITTIGVSYILYNAVLLGLGAQARNYPNPLPRLRLPLGPAFIELRQLLVWVVSVALMAGLYLFTQRTRLGRAMRAVAGDAEAARMMGVDVDRVVMIAFFASGALAGAGGLVFGLSYNYTSVLIGFSTGLRAFTAAVLGGIGSIQGAMAGGVLIGLIEALASQFIAAAWADVIIFSILVLVLVFRPAGLFGTVAPQKS